MSNRLYTPVTFIFFNRPDATMRVLEEIKKAKPLKLYLVSDGPRENRPGEKATVEQLRRQVEEGIDWDCEIHREYAQKNMGCHMRMKTGISATLLKEETTIILEDDIIPVPTFFLFCQEMLEKYRDAENVFYISGNNLYQKFKMNASYTFSDFPSIWGWATWRRAWNHYDDSMHTWEEIKKEHAVEQCYGKKWAKYFIPQIESAYTGERDTWDYQWEASRMRYGGLGIIPRYNMIENIGFDREDATHTKGGSMYDFSKRDLEFPLKHPVIQGQDIKADAAYDKGYKKHIIAREFERLYFWGKVKRRCRMLFGDE